jgi:hypothetical protein
MPSISGPPSDATWQAFLAATPAAAGEPQAIVPNQRIALTWESCRGLSAAALHRQFQSNDRSRLDQLRSQLDSEITRSRQTVLLARQALARSMPRSGVATRAQADLDVSTARLQQQQALHDWIDTALKDRTNADAAHLWSFRSDQHAVARAVRQAVMADLLAAGDAAGTVPDTDAMPPQERRAAARVLVADAVRQAERAALDRVIDAANQRIQTTDAFGAAYGPAVNRLAATVRQLALSSTEAEHARALLDQMHHDYLAGRPRGQAAELLLAAWQLRAAYPLPATLDTPGASPERPLRANLARLCERSAERDRLYTAYPVVAALRALLVSAQDGTGQATLADDDAHTLEEIESLVGMVERCFRACAAAALLTAAPDPDAEPPDGNAAIAGQQSPVSRNSETRSVGLAHAAYEQADRFADVLHGDLPLLIEQLRPTPAGLEQIAAALALLQTQWQADPAPTELLPAIAFAQQAQDYSLGLDQPDRLRAAAAQVLEPDEIVLARYFVLAGPGGLPLQDPLGSS